MAAATTPPDDPTDVVGRRAVAYLIDLVLVALIGLVVFAALRYRSYTDAPADMCTLLRKTADNPICLKVGSRVFLWHPGAAKHRVLVTLFFGLLNNVVLQSITGSTVGKACFRLSVVDESGVKTHPLRMFGRWVILVVDVGFCLVGCFMTLATHPHRRIGDFVFGTYVVSMSSVGRPVVVAPGAKDAAAGLTNSEFKIDNAQGSASTMQTQAEADITEGASVLLVDALDSGSGAAIEANATAKGVKVIDYDRLVKGGPAGRVYVSFDNVQGRQARSARARSTASRRGRSRSRTS